MKIAMGKRTVNCQKTCTPIQKAQILTYIKQEKMCLPTGAKMKWVSSVGNKGQTKPEFLISNFMFCKGKRVNLPFKPLGGRKKHCRNGPNCLYL
jgi:hypothetical protein